MIGREKGGAGKEDIKEERTGMKQSKKSVKEMSGEQWMKERRREGRMGK